MGKGRLLTIEESEKLKGTDKKIILDRGNREVIVTVGKSSYRSENDKFEATFRCVGLESGEFQLYEYIEEPKTYKTSEMIAMLEENPKLKFKDFDDEEFVAIATDEIYGKSRICWNGVFESPLYVVVGEGEKKWALIEEPKEVTFIEAAKAFNEGETIKSKYGKFEHVYNPVYSNFISDENNIAVSAKEIINAKWYIMEESK